MEILQLMPQYPYPMIDGGKVGLHSVAKAFSELSSNHTAMCTTLSTRHEALECGIHYEIVSHSTNNSVQRMLASLVQTEPLYLSKHFNSALCNAVDTLIKEGDFRVIHADHTAMAPLAYYASKKHRLPWGLRLHNIEWMIWQRYAKDLPRGPKRWYVQMQAEKLRQREQELIGLADVVFAITEVDAQRALELSPNANVVHVPPGIDVHRWDVPAAVDRGNEVVIATNYRWVHNVDGLRWFVENVWPKTLSKEPSASLHLIGNEPPTEFTTLQHKRIFCEGFVEDLAERFSHAKVAICPLFVGSGVRIKILEAMAAGLPVVATSVGAEGIELSTEEGLFVSDDASEQATTILQLLSDDALSHTLRVKAQEAIQQRYSVTASAQQMIEAYKQLAQ